MALIATTRDRQVGKAVRVGAVVVDGATSLVWGEGAGGEGPLRRFPAVPDVALAHRWVCSLRRVLRVEITTCCGGEHRCLLSGIGHRWPVTHRVSLATALGFAVLGFPVLVDPEAA